MPSFWSKFGTSAEDAVCRWLQSLEYSILDRNWRRPWGELDIIASKGGVIHFIEVKASKVLHQGFEPYVRAGGQKMLKVRRTARTWLSAHQIGEDSDWQIDIISVVMDPNKPVFEYFENI